VSQIHVLVATTSSGLAAEVIAAAVARCDGMTLLGDSAIVTSDVEELLTRLSPTARCALVLVGRASDTEAIEERLLRRHKRLVVLRVDIIEDLVHLAAREVGMAAVLAAVRDLVDGAAALSRRCLLHIAPLHFRRRATAPPAVHARCTTSRSCAAPKG
jgi:hypothetical protein